MSSDSSIPFTLHQNWYRRNSLGCDTLGLRSDTLQAAEDSRGVFTRRVRLYYPTVEAAKEERHRAWKIHFLGSGYLFPRTVKAMMQNFLSSFKAG